MKKFHLQMFFVFFTSLLICGVISFVLVTRKYEIEYAKMERIVLSEKNKIENVLSKLLYKTQALAFLVVQSDGSVKNFETSAFVLLDDPAVLNVLLAPNGVITDIFPREGNEAALGLNLFEKGLLGNEEAIMAKESSQLVLGGPFELRQGGEALVGRLPVYVKGRFWGLVSVTLAFPKSLDGAELTRLQEQNMAYEIWRINPDTNSKQVIARSTDYNEEAPYLEVPLEIINAKWYFRIAPIKLWWQYPESWLWITCCILISTVLAMAAHHIYNLRWLHSRLELMAMQDFLTELPNRAPC